MLVAPGRDEVPGGVVDEAHPEAHVDVGVGRNDGKRLVESRQRQECAATFDRDTPTQFAEEFGDYFRLGHSPQRQKDRHGQADDDPLQEIQEDHAQHRGEVDRDIASATGSLDVGDLDQLNADDNQQAG